MKKFGLAKHCHHNVLFDYVYDFDERVKYIKENKPKDEQALRLKLFQLVPNDKIPGKDSAEWNNLVKASKNYVRSFRSLKKEYEKHTGLLSEGNSFKYTEAFYASMEKLGEVKTAWVEGFFHRRSYEKRYREDLIKLHDELCPDCPWDGKTIFPNKET